MLQMDNEARLSTSQMVKSEVGALTYFHRSVRGGRNGLESERRQRKPNISNMTMTSQHCAIKSCYATVPAPPRLRRKHRGQIDGPPFPPTQEARWRDRPGLRSDFSGRKGGGRGELDKSAAVALFHPLTQLYVMNTHTHTQPSQV